MSDSQIVWRESKSEVKQSGPLWELATSTATPLSIGTHWGTDCVCVCLCVLRCWLQLLGCLCRRQLEVDVATAEQRDNTEPVLRLRQTHTNTHTKAHTMATLSLGYVSESCNHKLIENFMKCWPQKLNNTLFGLVWCPNVCVSGSERARITPALGGFKLI